MRKLGKHFSHKEQYDHEDLANSSRTTSSWMRDLRSHRNVMIAKLCARSPMHLIAAEMRALEIESAATITRRQRSEVAMDYRDGDEVSAQPNLLPFRAPSAPQSLVEKYRPHSLSDFCGIVKPKEILQRLAERPYTSSWIFRGESGTGKTTAAQALAEMIPAEIQHIGSQELTINRIKEVWERCCQYSSRSGWWLNLVDEVDTGSKAAHDYLLSRLDSTASAPDTIWVLPAIPPSLSIRDSCRGHGCSTSQTTAYRKTPWNCWNKSGPQRHPASNRRTWPGS